MLSEQVRDLFSGAHQWFAEACGDFLLLYRHRVAPHELPELVHDSQKIAEALLEGSRR